MDEFLNQPTPVEPEEPQAPDVVADTIDPSALPKSPVQPGSATNGIPSAVYQAPVSNPVIYSQLKPQEKAPISKGLKVFALLLSAVLVLTGASAAGYFVGKNNAGFTRKSVSVHLASRPKDTDEKTEAEVYEAVNSSIVGIMIYNTAGVAAEASGVFYSEDGYIVTNDHIYADIPSAQFKIYTADHQEYDADYVAGDQISDLAILKISSSSHFTPAEFGNSDELYFGEHVVAVGRPTDATGDSTITRGIVSSTGKRVTGTTSYSVKMIQTDSAINPGSSGGALVNLYGQVIGITSSKLAGSNYDAVGYAIPTAMMKRIAEELIENGHVVSRAKLGITYNAINSVSAKINGYDHVGLYVASVSEDSDLYGKLAKGDIITEINGIAITNDDIVLDIIQDSTAGDTITVTVYTASGSTKTYNAVLKANIGESSYSNQASSGNSSQGGVDGSGSDRSGGIFDFPSGE